jgi:hemolysin activation/secretion protein
MKNSHLNRYIAVFTTGVALLSGASAWAQAIPDSARPSAVEDQYRLHDEQPSVTRAPLISTPEEHAKHISGGASFKLTHINLEGDKTFGEEQLSPLYRDKLGTTITLDDLNEIADSITTYYRNHGYILTHAVVPPQHANDGMVTIRIVEGFVSNVKVQGDKAEDPQIRAYADKIRASTPLDAAVLERYLLLMDDLPGVQARAVLQPSPNTPGASEVVINVTRKPVEFAATLDNRGSRYLGPIQASASASVNNLFGLDDQTQFRVANSIFDVNELKYFEVRHEEQLGADGTKLVLSANHVETQPGYTLGALDLDGISNAFSAGVSYPVLRSRQSNLFVNSDFTVRNVDVDTFAGNFYYDKTRVLTVGTSYDFLDSTSAVNRMEASFANGFNWDTSDAQPRSRANADLAFKKLDAKVTRIQPISGPWSVYGAVAGQYSFNPLVASEEFALGGSQFGSAYDSAELTGDSAIAARGEIQFNQSNESNVVSQYQLYAFYDIGQVWNQDVIAGTEDKQASLSSTGLGVRFNLLESVSGGVEGALPLTRKVAAYGADGAAPRVFFNLQYRY